MAVASSGAAASLAGGHRGRAARLGAHPGFEHFVGGMGVDSSGMP